MEKIHGTSAHIRYEPLTESIKFFSGGTSHNNFVAMFDEAQLKSVFKTLTTAADKSITIYGESYGGKEQGMSATYGKVGKFVAFDVQIGELWVDVPVAEMFARNLGLEFVHYTEVSTDLPALDYERDKPSTQAQRNGIVGDKFQEGVILRPLKEMTLNNGSRVIAKHKRDEFRETASARSVEVDPAKLKVLEEAQANANEWDTPMRLEHVLQKIPDHDITKAREIIAAMQEDVTREAAGEIVVSNEAVKAIGTRTMKLYKEHLNEKLRTA